MIELVIWIPKVSCRYLLYGACCIEHMDVQIIYIGIGSHKVNEVKYQLTHEPSAPQNTYSAPLLRQIQRCSWTRPEEVRASHRQALKIAVLLSCSQRGGGRLLLCLLGFGGGIWEPLRAEINKQEKSHPSALHRNKNAFNSSSSQHHRTLPYLLWWRLCPPYHGIRRRFPVHPSQE